MSSTPQSVLVLGATGTIGQAVTQALIENDQKVTCVVRSKDSDVSAIPSQAILKVADITLKKSLDDIFQDKQFTTVVSCLGSRTGVPDDAWAIDCQANVDAISLAVKHGVKQFVLLSAICVQRPVLAFQFAKLEAEKVLMESGLHYSIVRPTAFFKSLSGQIKRVKAGKPFLVFGNGELTACKPISDRDLGQYIAQCVGSVSSFNAILPIGGPGPAITPKHQAQMLSQILEQPVKLKKVPVAFLSLIILLLSIGGKVFPKLRSKAELARIGRYYGTESMLVWNDALGIYDENLTPSAGKDSLYEHYTHILNNDLNVDLGDHSVF